MNQNMSGTNVCMPTLYITALVMLYFERRGNTYRIYFEMLPRYLRGLSRMFGISQQRIISFMQVITEFSINRIKHGDDVPDYPTVRLGAMGKVVTICDQIASEIEEDRRVALLGSLIGQKPALAYTLRYLAHYQIHYHITPFLACAEALGKSGKFLLVCSPGWSVKWFDVVKRNISGLDFSFFEWPKWFLYVNGLCIDAYAALCLLSMTIRSLFKRGLTFREIDKQRFKVMGEFVDPMRLNRTPFDADYWVDGTVVKTEDILLYLSSEQAKILIRDGYKIKNVIKGVEAKGYSVIYLPELALSVDILRIFLRLFKTFLWRLREPNIPAVCGMFIKAWQEYLEYAPLFSHFYVANSLHLVFPHGNASWRMNSALVTGLCRKYGTRSFGCQNRVIDSKQYEFSFDCYDVFFSWGSAWTDMLEEGMQFVDKVVETGSIHLDALAAAFRKFKNSREVKKRSLHVLIFPTDMVQCISVYSGAYYTMRYALNFLENCTLLAKTYPDIRFTVKLKDPEHYDLLLQQKMFRQIYDEVRGNFYIEKRPRCDYLDILSSADIIIAIGFTSPGIEALFLGKRVIYYNELRGHGSVFRLVPDMVAEDRGELTALFKKALNDYKTYAVEKAAQIRMLEPFCDGQALKRIATFWEGA